MAVICLSAAGTLGSGLVSGPRAQAANSNSGINFTWTRAEARIVASYAVTPTSQAQSDSATPASTSSPTADANDHQPDLVPKHPAAPPHAAKPASAGGAPTSDNTVATNTSNASPVPPLSASAIRMQGSNKICTIFPHGCNPPDMALAASPNDVLHGVNTAFD